MADPQVNRLLLGPGDKIGRYEIVAEIAQGGMATVYVARLTSIGGFGKLFAIKVLLPHLRSDRAFVNMLMDEARIAASIHHPNVVQVVDIAEYEGTPYIAMELLRGRSLAHTQRCARKAGTALPTGAVLAVLARAAEGLHAAHEARDETGAPLGIVHRDVSPQNIHLSFDGHVKVLDFGIAAAAGRLTETSHGEVKGKVEYMAPEQLNRKRAVDRRADVWALGVVAFELLCGRRLFRGEDFTTTMWNVLNREVPRLGDVVPRVPRDAARVVAAALSRDVDHRPTTCLELMHAFDAGATTVGGGSRQELASFMESTFARERAVEEERIAAVLREGPAPPLESPLEEDVPTLEEAPVRPRRRGLVLAVAATVMIGGAAAFVATSTSETAAEPSAVETPPTEAPDDEEQDDLSHAARPTVDVVQSPRQPAAATVTVEVDERARFVLVDGTRQDERPLAVAVPAGGSVVVELVDESGELVRHEITAEDEGRRLELPDRHSRRRPRPGSSMNMDEPRSSTGQPPSREILRDVFDP